MALRTLVLALALALVATVTFASPAGEEDAPAAAMGQEMVTDPTTGEMVTAPEYGGTLTYAVKNVIDNWDPYFGWTDPWMSGVAEKLAVGNWGLDRSEWDFQSGHPLPLSAITGRLAESWETPDNTTFVFHIRDGVRWHNKEPMIGRELTAQDVEFTFHRMLGLGEFADAGPSAFGGASNLLAMPFESVTATDDSTLVIELTEPNLRAFHLITLDLFTYIMPPEVIEEHGDIKDWRNLVGTGPFMLTEFVEGSSVTKTRNPDYWGFDEKYPENRLPYVDELRLLHIVEEATLQAALLSGKLDLRGPSGGWLSSIDAVDSMRKTNPEMVLHKQWFRSGDSFAPNLRQPPFDDIRVRRAMQMALDLETINNTYFKGEADATPAGLLSNRGYVTPFAEWPEEVKKGYTYDPEGAEKLLDEAGYPRGTDGTRFKTTVSWTIFGNLGYAEIAAAYWAEIGVDTQVDALEIGQWVEKVTTHTYEGLASAIAGTSYDPGMSAGWYHSESGNNRAGSQWPELDVLVEGVQAATTFEEQRKWVNDADMYAIENHWQIWGPKLPHFWALHPWVIGYNGEFDIGPNEDSLVLARLWIDSALKEEKGF